MADRKGFTYKGYRVKLIHDHNEWYAEASGPTDIDAGPSKSDEEVTVLIKAEIDRNEDNLLPN